MADPATITGVVAAVSSLFGKIFGGADPEKAQAVCEAAARIGQIYKYCPQPSQVEQTIAQLPSVPLWNGILPLTEQQSLSSLAPITQYCAREFVRIVESAGFSVTITSARRTFWEQAKLWWDWIRGNSKYPANKPGTSEHEFGRAFDCVLVYQNQALGPGDLSSIGVPALTEYCWLKWGGSKDHVHYQLDLRAVLRIYLDAHVTPPDELLEPVLET